MQEGETFEYQWGHGSVDTAQATVTTVYADGSYDFEYQVYGQWRTGYCKR